MYCNWNKTTSYLSLGWAHFVVFLSDTLLSPSPLKSMKGYRSWYGSDEMQGGRGRAMWATWPQCKTSMALKFVAGIVWKTCSSAWPVICFSAFFGLQKSVVFVQKGAVFVQKVLFMGVNNEIKAWTGSHRWSCSNKYPARQRPWPSTICQVQGPLSRE